MAIRYLGEKHLKGFDKYKVGHVFVEYPGAGLSVARQPGQSAGVGAGSGRGPDAPNPIPWTWVGMRMAMAWDWDCDWEAGSGSALI